MTAPANRSQRILHFIANQTEPVTLQQIIAAAEPGQASKKIAMAVSAYMCHLVTDGKVERAGKPRAFTYTRTEITLRDLRKIDREGKVRTRSKDRRPPKPAAKPAKAATAPKPKGKHVISSAQRIVIQRPRTQRAPGEPETVAEFLKRGGRIQKLKHGESSRPLYETARDLNAATMRKRLAEAADNDDTTDDELAVA